jgi:archaellum component FlaC
MKNPLPFLLIALAPAIASADNKLPDKVTFDEHIKPLMRNSCLNCHNPEKKKSGLDMTTYQGLMQGSDNGKVIIPGDPEKSVLYKCVTFADEPKMPPKSDKLSDPELELIRKFIEIGAPENAGSKVVVMKGAAPAAVTADEKAPDGPPPMPKDLLLEPVVRAARPGQVAALTASRWAPLVAVAGQKQVLLYNTDTLELAGVLPFPEGFPYVLKFSRNCQLLLAGGGVGASYGRVVVWDVVTGERVLEAGDETDAVLAADISPDHSRIVLGGPTKWLKVFSGTDGSPIKQIKKHTDWVTAIAFSPDGKYLVTADRSGNAYVWDASIRELWSLTGHKGPITGVSVSGAVAATSSEDGTVKLWNLKTGETIRTLTAHNGGVESVEFTRDGKLVTCGRDKFAKLFEQAGGNAVKTFEEFPDIAMRATFTSGKVIAGDWTGAIRVWNVADAKRAGELSANPAPIAERLDAATKRVAELGPQREKAAAEVTRAEAAAKQANAEVDAANKAIADTQARIKELETQQIPALTKAKEGAKNALQQAQNDLTQKRSAAQGLANKAAEARTASQRVANELAPLEKTLADKRAGSAQAADAATKARAEADKQPDNKALADTATQTKTAADKAAADIAQTETARAAKAEEAKRLAEAAAKAKEAADQAASAANSAQQTFVEKTAALEKVRAEFTAATQALAKATNDLPAAKKLVPAKTDQAKAAADAFAKTKQAADQAVADFAATTASIAKLKAAQVNVSVYAARAELAQREADYNKLLEEAKQLPLDLDKAKADLAGAQKTATEAPQQIKAKEAAIAQADRETAAANDALTKAKSQVGESEAKLKDATTQSDKAKAEAAKSPADAALADAAAKAKSALDSLTAELAKAREAVEKSTGDSNRAKETHDGAQKELAQLKEDAGAAPARIQKLRKTVDELTAKVTATRKEGTKKIDAARAQLDAAKTKAEKLKREYETLRDQAQIVVASGK